MNKRLRSRVLAASMVSSTLLGAGGLLAPQILMAQDKPSAAELLDRGTRLYDQKQYGEAKKILLDIDPAQLPEDLRAKRADLIKNSDLELAKASGPSGALDAAQADLDGDKLAAAAGEFQAIIDSPAAPKDVKDKAKVQLALTRDKQAAKAPAMKELLNQAESLYKAGKLDEAQNALTTIQATGSDLGWQDREKPAALQAKITEARTAMARGNAAPPPAPANITISTEPPMVAVAPTAPVTGDMQVAAPGTVVATAPASAPAPATAPNPDTLLGQQELADKVERDRALTIYRQELDASSRALTQHPPAYDAAIGLAQNAVNIIDESRRYFSESEAAAYRDSAQRQLDMIKLQKASFEEGEKKIVAIQTEQAEKAHQEKLKRDRDSRVHSLMIQAGKFQDTQQYRESADLYRQVLVIQPTNDEAKRLLQYTTDRINYREYQNISNIRSQETQRQAAVDEEEMIPYTDLLIYPSDWVELTRNRAGDQSNADTPANRVVRERLDENLKEIAAEQLGFEKVIDFLRANTGTNIFVNWTALQGAGIDRNTPVTVNLREVPFRKALTTILSEVGGGAANLGYTIDDGVITISTRDDLNSARYQVVRVFDIRDMLVVPDTNIKPPSFDLTQITANGSTGGGTGGGSSSSNASGSLFTDTGGAGGTNPSQSRDQIVKDIIDTIKTTVAPESWRDTGGTIGTLRELNGQLIVNQTVDNQTAVYNLLQQLRETRALQIAIEARILLVTNNFFDQLGFNWNLGITNLAPSFPSLTVNNGNSANVAVPSGTGVPGSINTFGAATAQNGLNVGAAFGGILDNFTLNLVLAASQVDGRTITVDAPRVTLFNGQSGYIAITEQQNFVSNFNQTVTAGNAINGVSAVATTLTVSTLTTGVILFVEATVSSDRRYVVMKAKPQLSQLEGLQLFSSGGVQNPSFSSGGGFVQLPKIRYTTVQTMVSVPDGGTLLIGGEKIVGESEIEVGVPVLSKIPGLQRLFTNRAMNKDERTLLILVRPKIIIQKEIENNLFGPGYDKPTGLPNPNAGGGQIGGGVNPGFSVSGVPGH